MTNAWSFLYDAMNDDVITFDDINTSTFIVNMDEKAKLNKYKYNEDKILKELQDYITGTYNQHYSAGDDKIQTLDLIEACGCLLYTSPSPRDLSTSRMPSSA